MTASEVCSTYLHCGVVTNGHVLCPILKISNDAPYPTGDNVRLVTQSCS